MILLRSSLLAGTDFYSVFRHDNHLAPPRAESDFVFLNGIFLSLLFIVAAATPMLVVRRNGGMLASREFFLKLSKDYESAASKKVVNPFDD